MSYLAISILVYAAYVPLSLFIVATFGLSWSVPLFAVSVVGFIAVIAVMIKRWNDTTCYYSSNRLQNPIVLKNCDGDICIRYIVLKKTLLTESVGMYTLRPFDTVVLNSMTGGFRVIDETRFENIVGDSFPKLLSAK